MTTPAIWGTALWGDASWNTLLASGAITEWSDAASGGIAVCDPIGGLITEAPDQVSGEVLVIYTLAGDITEGQDVTEGAVSLTIPISGDITEDQDIADGGIADFLVNYVSGFIKEKKDVVSGESNIIIRISGAVKERRDVVKGSILTPHAQPRPGGGWAPQFHYKRDWEIEAEAVPVEDDFVYEPDPEALFIPTALPIDPAVARIIQSMMQGAQPVDTDDDDMEALLMHL